MHQQRKPSNESSAMTSTYASLSSVVIFSGLDRDALDEIDRLSTEVDVKSGYVLAAEGSIGREFGVILEGTAKVTIDGVEVATLRSGDHYGEVALLAELGQGYRRGATVTATSDMRIAVMSISEFATMLAAFPTINSALTTGAKNRLAQNAR
jgi:CRP/FNR family transcriptional regulator, cyclic AMP receptor protein